MENSDKKIYSLKELLDSVGRMFEKHYYKSYWIRAELLKLNRYEGKYCSPLFVEKQNDKIVVDIRGIIWDSTFQWIDARFRNVVGEPLSDGMQLVMRVQLQFDTKRGITLKVEDIDPTYTVGDMAMQKARIMERLKKTGLFDKNSQLPEPFLPRSIAIISVETSKGYEDFNKVLDGYAHRFRPFCRLFHAILQGEKAADSIVEALNQIRRSHALFNYVVIIRGGGSEVGLSCYDNELLATTIANFPIPVLAAIGHTANEPIAGMVAFKNISTPTEAAHYLVKRFEEKEKELKNLAGRIAHNTRNYLEKNELKISQRAQLLRTNVKRIEKDHQLKIDELQNSIRFCSGLVVDKKRSNLNLTIQRLEKLPELTLNKSRNDLEIIEIKIKMSNPKFTLQKGFTMTRKDGKTLFFARDLRSGDRIITEFQDGIIESIVQ